MSQNVGNLPLQQIAVVILEPHRGKIAVGNQRPLVVCGVLLRLQRLEPRRIKILRKEIFQILL